MKETIKAWAVHNKPLAKCLAIAKYIKYIKRGNGYQEVQQVLETFVKAEKRTDRRYIQELTLDMFFSVFYYQVDMEEYFWYQFEGKTDSERRAYIGSIEKDRLCAEISDAKSRRTLADKYECYVFFKKFFGRDVIKVSGQEDKAVFEEFLSKHKKFIVKPLDWSEGKGIYCITAESMDVDKCFQKVLASSPCVVEQCIDQVYEMAQFHPQSVNTVRIATFNNAGRIKVLFSIFRTGIGSSVVDNTAQGGLFASVNIVNGRTQSDAYAGNGRVYQTHPDTGCVFDGFQVPYWSDLVHVAINAAQTFPQHNYICWDFALTNCGWVMVEANSRGNFLGYQMFSGGIREVFMKEFREYKNQKVCNTTIH